MKGSVIRGQGDKWYLMVPHNMIKVVVHWAWPNH